MKCYKGFDKNLKCRDFQYVFGKTYEEPEAGLCSKGFHACTSPLDVLHYYPPANGRYCEVDLCGVSEQTGIDSKRVGKKITIGAEIGIRGLAMAHVEYVKSHTTTEHTDPKMATAGDSGAATAGNCGAATAGHYGAATSRGSSSVGSNGIACARGNNVMVRGGLGSVLVIAEENTTNHGVSNWKAAIVDGDTIKADTWYMLKGGEIVEASGNDADTGR